jgi:hypothetical protein
MSYLFCAVCCVRCLFWRRWRWQWRQWFALALAAMALPLSLLMAVAPVVAAPVGLLSAALVRLPMPLEPMIIIAVLKTIVWRTFLDVSWHWTLARQAVPQAMNDTM